MRFPGLLHRVYDAASGSVRRLTRARWRRTGLDGAEVSLRELHQTLLQDRTVFAIELRLGAHKRRFGLLWPKHWPEVERLVQQTLDEAVGDNGRFAFAGEAYVFLFRGIGHDQARAAVAAISEAIRQYGDRNEVAPLSPVGGPAEPSAMIELHPDDGAAEGLAAEAPHAAAGATQIAQAGWSPSQNGAAAVQREWSSSADGAAMSMIVGSAENGWGARPPPTRAQRRMISGLETAIKAATARQEWENRKHAEARVFPPPNLQFVYRPMWNPRTGTLSTYRIYPALARSPFEFDLGNDVLPPRARREDETHLDHLVLGRVIYDLIVCPLPPPRPFIGVPIHIATLEDAESRDAYFDIAASIPDSQRKHVLFEILDADRLVGPAQLLSWRRDLSQFGAAVMGLLPVTTPDFAIWNEVGLRAVGCNMRASQYSETEAIARFNDFVTLAREYQLKTFVRGLKTMSLTIGALGAGFDFVEGDTVQNALPNTAAAIESFALERLYSVA